jgi:hypothetical protein
MFMSNTGFKTVYLYGAQGLYDGPYNAQESPLEPGVYLLPEQYLDTAPIIAAGTWPVCTSGAWVNEPDFRGQVFYNTEGIAITIEALGAVPAGLLAAPPAPTLAAVQANQVSVLNAACQSAITAGFVSTALGASYTYPSAITDQQNLSANVVSSLLPSLPSGWTSMQMCCDASGIWGYVKHTAAQIQQVGADVKAAIMALLVRNTALQIQVSEATTVAQVQAVTW